MKYRVTHTTAFHYEARVGLCYNLARIRPRVLHHQQVSSAILQIDPLPHDHSTDLDYFGNRIDYFSIQQPHDQLAVTAMLTGTVLSTSIGMATTLEAKTGAARSDPTRIQISKRPTSRTSTT